MKTPRFLMLGLAVLCAWTPAAWAEKKATLGVFLPTTLTDGQERFTFAESLASQLSTVLGQPVAAKSFGRYEDFDKAVKDGLVDFAVVDALSAVQMEEKATPLAFAALAGETAQRWALISNMKGSVKDLKGKRLALTRSAGGLDAKFVSRVVFGGDLPEDHFGKPILVPNVESALKMLEAKGAEAALVPLSHVPKDVRVLFRSIKVPGAVLVTLRPGELAEKLPKLEPVAPFSGFLRVQGKEFEDFRKLVQKGPAPRQPALVESPQLRVDTDALVRSGQLTPVLPSFTSVMDVSSEQPDD
ncbi:PhnD/SsuA/transferrin family substrate-binding protein [Stigmatella hybrida]|uniref:PhnD/SsuA/transferrin family substrate-binding protein n=1 Tax=Stigmatella hybrida TaxID=394097 RepID=UPI001CDA89D5|nr:PhnD/SsuA/transferrin family substrate-binding protein [Stigmatella hybrida]